MIFDLSVNVTGDGGGQFNFTLHQVSMLPSAFRSLRCAVDSVELSVMRFLVLS